MICRELDDAVPVHVLQKCSCLQQSHPTVWVGAGLITDAQPQAGCWVAWKARVIDRMPCTLGSDAVSCA